MRLASATRPVHTRSAWKWLALCAVIGPILFAVGAFGLALTHPGYSVVSQQVSALAIGPNGVFMRSLFLLEGTLAAVGVVAIFYGIRHELGPITRWAAPAVLIVSPLGVFWAGIFTMDHLQLHNIGAQAVFAFPVIGFPVAGIMLRRAPSWRRFGTIMILGGPLTLLLLIGFLASLPLDELRAGMSGGFMGLWQRTLGLEVMGWYAVFGWLASRRPAIA